MGEYFGGCQCGSVRYEIDVEPQVAYCCHCTDCQRQSGSAFGISVWFPADAFRLTQGELSTWITKAESGNDKHCAYCRMCGVRIYHAVDDGAGTISVKGGSLDRMPGLKPVAQIWTRSAQNWMFEKLVEEYCFAREPDDFQALILTFQDQQKA